MFVTNDNNGFDMPRQQVKVKGWLSTSEAASLAFVDQSTIIRWCQRIPGFASRVGYRYRISPQALANQIGESYVEESGTIKFKN